MKKGWGRKDLPNCTVLGPTVTEQHVLHLASFTDQDALTLPTLEAGEGEYLNG